MKTIDNVSFKQIKDVEDYAALIRNVANRPPAMAAGITPDQMQLILKVLEALDKSAEQIDLEDTQWEWVRDRVNDFPWPQAHVELAEFIKAVRDA